MGYRTLLQRYIQHVELAAGDNFIEARVAESELTARDLGELRSLAADIRRNERAARPATARNPNQRLRLWMSRYSIDAEELAGITGFAEDQIRRWRSSPRSPSYLYLDEDDLNHIEQSVERWLESLAAREAHAVTHNHAKPSP
jgi:hypothetical protein